MNLQDLNQFHFIRPEWLWALAILAVLWLLIGNLRRSTHWESFIAQDKLEALRVTGGRYSNAWRWLLISGWIVGTLAAAGPTWKQIPVPTVRDESAMVILLDLSRSMLSQDLAPDRLTRSKYKLIDILRQRGDGQTALVAYAGDPHTVSPLADDPKTIEALLPALHPDIMPVQGSNTEAAIELALQLLRDAGQTQGEILLLTDGVEAEAQRTIRDLMDGSFRLTILGIGSVEAVPIPREDGGFYRDSRGEIILTKLNRDELQILAGLSGGRYVELQSDDSDIQYLLEDEFKAVVGPDDEQSSSLLYDSWEDMGYWLVLLLLPFAAFSFRKGAIYLAPLYLAPLLLLSPSNAEALSWNDIWLNADQQGAKLLDQDNPQDAAGTFKRQDWAATADYRAGNYQAAAESFAESEDIASTYNRGNALAFQGDLEGSLAAYNQVLEQQPGHADAAHNKSVVEQLLQQQEQQEQQSESDENSDESSDEDSDPQEGSDSESESESESEQQQENSDQESEQQSEQNSDQSSDQDRQQQSEQSEQEQSDASEDEQETEQQQQSETEQQSEEEQSAAEMMAAEPTPDQLEDASEQWLRAIPDDPSGLLRRKFDYETRQNNLEQRYRLQLPTNPDDERY